MREANTQLTEELIAFLKEAGADLVGIGDLTALDDAQTLGHPIGISVAVKYAPEIILEVQQQPGQRYQEVRSSTVQKLDEIVLAGEAFLKEKGYAALAQDTGHVTFLETRRTRLPHKTVATRAGLGWVGKHCLLVTPEYGSAVRLSSLLTDAPLVCGQPINTSRCGACHHCVDLCPVGALKNTLWKAGAPRSEIADVEKCAEYDDPCGKCFANCMYTQAYLKRMGVK